MTEDEEPEALSTGQYRAIVAEELSKPVEHKPTVPPKADFLYSEEVRKLSQTQKEARDRANAILSLLPSAKRR